MNSFGPFFLLPFFLMAGVAIQSTGLYFCLVIWMFVAGQGVARSARRAVLSASALLALVYLIPVIAQSILALQIDPLRFCVIDPPKIKSCDIQLSTWLKSPASSSFIGLAIGWAVHAIWRRGNQESSQAQAQSVTPAGLQTWNDDPQRFGSFALGLLISSVFFFVYNLVQHATGFSALLKTHMLEDEHRMPNGMYRIFGFYGHPLSMAAASLVWCSLALHALWIGFKEKSKVLNLNIWAWAIIAVIHSLNIYMSGGRTAALVAALGWTLLGAKSIWFLMTNRFFKKWFAANAVAARLILAGSFCAVAAVLIVAFLHFAPSLGPRGIGGGTMGQGPLGDRPLFWQVYLAMWRESPMFGQGFFAIEHGLRTHFYVREGFAALVDKFNAHNIFLEVLGVSGLFGLFAYMVVLVLMWVNLKVLAGNSPARKVVLHAIGFAVLANLLHGLTQNTFYDSAVSACYLGLIGTLVVPPLRPKADTNHTSISN